MAGAFEHLNLVEKAVAVVGAAGLAFTTFRANTIQNELSSQKVQIERVADEQKRQLDLRKDEREENRQQNELTREIFQEFVKAITEQSAQAADRLDRLEGVLVLTYAIPDPRQQEGMGRAVQKAIARIRTPEVATRVNEATFDAEELVARASAEQRPAPETKAQPPKATTAVQWSNYDFDVFWCDGLPESPALQQKAGEILELKALDPSATGRWRPRSLPPSINERPGYRVTGYQIRYSSPDEKVLADALKSQIEAKAPAAKVEAVATNQNTPWYLSVFVCP